LHQSRLPVRLIDLHDPNDVLDTLDGTEVWDVGQISFILLRKSSSQSSIRRAAVHIAIDEVGNNKNGPEDLKFLDRALSEVVRHCGNGVALLDAKAGDGKV